MSAIEKLLHRIANSHAHIEKMEANIELCSKGTTPPQCKPFALPFECDEWDEPLGKNEAAAKLIVPAGEEDTFEMVARRLHMESTASKLILTRMVEGRRLDRLKEEASLDNFIAACSVVSAQEKETMEKLARGLKAGDAGEFPNFDVEIKDACVKCYRAQLRSIAVENLKTMADKKKQKEKEERALEAAALLPVEEVVKRGLKELLKNKPGKKKAQYDTESQVLDFAKFLNISAATGDALRGLGKEQLEPKNELTPGGGRGQNAAPNTGKGKSEGKGSTKTQSKGKGKRKNPKGEKNKGKGKGQPKDAEKGKGKGKSKSKDGGKGGKNESTNGGGKGKKQQKNKGS
jgi:hypothetical protein